MKEIRNEKKILGLIQSIAPPLFLENDDSVAYLSSFLADPESVQCENLVSIIVEFFGNEHECEARMLAQAVVLELSLDDEDETKQLNAAGVENIKAFSLGAGHYGDGFFANNEVGEGNTDIANDSDEQQSMKRTPIARVKAKKITRTEKNKASSKEVVVRDEKKDARVIQAIAAAELEQLDDHSSAWQECVTEGKTWGGRGLGGRGLRSVYTPTTSRVTSLHLQNVSLQFAGNDLLQNATIQITEKKRYGLIGRNGCGKSVLLRRLAAKSIPGFPIQMKVLFVRQEVEGSSTTTALQTLLDADEDRMVLLEDQKRLEEMLESPDPKVVASAASRLGELSSELELQSDGNPEDRARDILKGLQFSETMIQSPTEHLSGGWKMRLALAQVLYVRSDLLLLDLHAVFWLGNYLSKSDRTILLVSHDRAFLDAVCTDIIHFSHQKLMYYLGNYSSFEQRQVEKAARDTQILDATERKRSKAIEFVERHQHASSKKHGFDPNKQRQAKTIRDKKLDRIGNFREDGKRYKNFSLKKMSEEYLRTSQQVEVEAVEAVVRFKLPNPIFSTSLKEEDSVISVDNVSFAYSKQSATILNDVSAQIRAASKIAVVGRNGSGKSTLLKLIIGEIEQHESITKGILWRHPTLRIGYIAQHDVEALAIGHASKTPIEYAGEKLREYADSADMAATTGSIRQYLGAYGLGGKHASRPIASLSGGERMRLCFAATFARRPHLLLLDMVNKSIVAETLDALASALDSFKGAIVIVSHNQRFLCAFCNELWIVEDGRVDVQHGDTSEFEENFAIFKSETLSDAHGRSATRNKKTAIAKKAMKQRTTPKTGGFIG